MHERLQTPYAKAMKKRRQATVEPVPGTVINFMGVRRIWSRGLQSANKFMLGAAIAYNLKKWLNFKAPATRTATMALKNAAKAVYFYFFYTMATSASSQQQIQNKKHS